MAITRLWFFTLKPTTSPTDPTFLALWAQILDLCASYTPTPTASTSQVHVAHISTPHPQRSHHFLFQHCPSSSSSSSSATIPDEKERLQQGGAPSEFKTSEETPLFVLISTYPSLAFCSQADAAYRLKFQARLFEMVDHLALRQMDMEETETVPKLLASAHTARKRDADGDDGGGVTVTISSRDPLRVEVEGSVAAAAAAAREGGVGRGSGTPIPPLDVEVSGADVYQVPSAPSPALDGGGAGGGHGTVDGDAKRDRFQAQRKEGKKWIRISRGWDIAHQDGEVEVFRLKEVVSR